MKGRMPNKLYPFRKITKDATVSAAGRRRFYLVFALLIIGFLSLESSAFYSAVGFQPTFGTCAVSLHILQQNALFGSRSRTGSVSTQMKRGRIILFNAKSDDQSSSCVDERPKALQKSQNTEKSSEGRRNRWRRSKVRNEEQLRTTQGRVPHSGRHFFPSHPAYRPTYFRRLFSKLRKRKRFMEGWYYRLTLKDYEVEGDSDSDNNNKPVSFAFIISIEDAGITSSDLRLACLQAIGPDDQYLVQSTKDDTKFWASKEVQSLGCTFEEWQHYNNSSVSQNNVAELDPAVWKESVRSGFQIIDGSSSKTGNHLNSTSKPRWMGRILGHDGSEGGVLDGQGVQGTVEFDFEVDPNSVCGYGGYTTSTAATDSVSDGDNPSTNNNTIARVTLGQTRRRQNHDAAKQKSTGGWLSSFPVFEPHWQVTIADALASGSVNWNGRQYKFKDQPFYAEKNWGDALPSKWYWTQCNSFDNYEGELSVTAGGGVRKLPFGKEEELGMVAIHYKGNFYEAVPWKGNVEWNVSTWGEWSLYGDRLEETFNYGFNSATPTTTTTPFAAEIRYRCDPKKLPGLVFRAPTPKQGMVPFCRDTFEADCELTLWELRRNELTNEFEKVEPPIIDRATSSEGGAEIGGGPWWSEWQGKSELKPIVKALLNFPKNLVSKIV